MFTGAASLASLRAIKAELATDWVGGYTCSYSCLLELFYNCFNMTYLLSVCLKCDIPSGIQTSTLHIFKAMKNKRGMWTRPQLTGDLTL